MTRSEYLALPGLNFSKAKALLVSPAKFIVGLDEPDDPLKHVVGKLVHAMVLECKNLTDLYAIKPHDLNLTTKYGRAWKAAQTLPIIREEDANRVPRMAEAICNHVEASNALRSCKGREVFMQSEYKGVAIKGILDAVGRNVLEIKTCLDPSDEAFGQRAVSKPYHYDAQVAWYMALSGLQVAWILVENTAPYTVNFVYPEIDIITSGQRKMDIIITKWKRCKELGDWSASACGDFQKELHGISGPMWLGKQLEGAGLL
jgi:hypothetical protein